MEGLRGEIDPRAFSLEARPFARDISAGANKGVKTNLQAATSGPLWHMGHIAKSSMRAKAL